MGLANRSCLTISIVDDGKKRMPQKMTVTDDPVGPPLTKQISITVKHHLNDTLDA